MELQSTICFDGFQILCIEIVRFSSEFQWDVVKFANVDVVLVVPSYDVGSIVNP